MRIGYLVPEFPGQTHIMFWREIQALRRSGEYVAVVSTRRPSVQCPHAFADEAAESTHYIYPPSVPELARWLATGAQGLSRALGYLNELGTVGAANRAKLYALLFAAVDLGGWARRNRIDHVHGHSCADAAHVLAIAHRLTRLPYSLTLHGDLGVYGTDHRAKMRNAAFVQIVGQHLRDQVEDQTDLSGDRIVVTFMGVETMAAQEPAMSRSDKLGQLHLVTVARLHPAKGHIHLLRAIDRGVRKGLDLRYTIVGGGEHRSALVDLTRELGLQDRVTFTGPLSEVAIFDLLSKADVFVLPSTGLGEAWPVSIMEAMSAALPIIATTIGATPDIVRDGIDGFLIPQADEEALLSRLELLAGNVGTRRKMGDAARVAARQRFDVRISAGLLREAILASLDRDRQGKTI